MHNKDGNLPLQRQQILGATQSHSNEIEKNASNLNRTQLEQKKTDKRERSSQKKNMADSKIRI